MAPRVCTVAFQGIDELGVGVQVQMAGGVPAFANVRPIPEERIDLLILPDFDARTAKAATAPDAEGRRAIDHGLYPLLPHCGHVVP